MYIKKNEYDSETFLRVREKSIGYMQNMFRARETTFNSVTVLVLAVVGGLPGEAIALKIAISMAFGLLLDVPLGVLADRVGHARAVLIGMYCLAAAPITLVLPCLYEFSYEVTIIFVVANALLGAFGSSFVSGAYEALTLGLVENLNRSVPARNLNRYYDATAVTSLQRHGSAITLVLPATAIVATLLLDRLWQAGYIMLIAPSLMAIGFTQILAFKKGGYRKNEKQNTMFASFKLFFRYAAPILMIAAAQITMIHANAYTLISAININTIRTEDWNTFYLSAGMSCSFFVGFFVKAQYGWYLISNIRKDIIPIICVSVSSALSLFCYTFAHKFGGMFSLFIFGSLFRLFFSTAQEVMSNTLLSMISSDNRAAIMSLARTLAIGAYALFSAYLVYRDEHIPTLSENLISVALLCIVIAIALLADHVIRARNPTAG